MSWTALLEYDASCAEDDTPEPPLEWLLAMLKQAMEEVMAGEATPLQKANAIARLGNLYLKTYRAAELTKENKALARRVAELEERLAVFAGEGPTGEERTVTGSPARARDARGERSGAPPTPPAVRGTPPADHRHTPDRLPAVGREPAAAGSYPGALEAD